MKRITRLLTMGLPVLLIFMVSCEQVESSEVKSENCEEISKNEKQTECEGCLDAYVVDSKSAVQNASDHLITFVELGSVNCVPCKQMQPVMKAIEENYGGQIKIIFYDVWKEDQSKYADQFGIRLIPTQVFLDKEGNEIFRHEGFFPEEEIDIFLQKQGLKSKKKS